MSKKWIGLGIVVLIILILVSIVWGSYNSLVSLQQGVEKSWADVETQYQRRINLVPNLESIVEGAAGFEKSTLTALTDLRTKWQNQPTPEARIQTANEFESALSKLILTFENYPDIKSTQNFLAFQDALTETENMVAVARTRYNDAVRSYNTVVRVFPSNVIAGWFGFKESGYFEAITPGAEQAPKVDIEIGG